MMESVVKGNLVTPMPCRDDMREADSIARGSHSNAVREGEEGRRKGGGARG
jgi:hypothetical protein